MGEAGAWRHRKAVRATLTLALIVSGAGCEKPPSPAEQARIDAEAIAQVEAAQDAKPPIEPVELAVIVPGDREALGLTGARCELIPGAPPAGDPVVVAGPKRATLKIAGRARRLASDPGSAPMPLGTWSHYVGKELSLTLGRGGGDGVSSGSDRQRWSGRVTVRDRYDRVVYTADGALDCGA